jgi:hypothetical protein
MLLPDSLPLPVHRFAGYYGLSTKSKQTRS